MSGCGRNFRRKSEELVFQEQLPLTGVFQVQQQGLHMNSTNRPNAIPRLAVQNPSQLSTSVGCRHPAHRMFWDFEYTYKNEQHENLVPCDCKSNHAIRLLLLQSFVVNTLEANAGKAGTDQRLSKLNYKREPTVWCRPLSRTRFEFAQN